jgi:formylglycine-generating enzyme required for sulfatase activity
VLEHLEGVRKLRLAILDACRANPFPAAKRSSTRGLKSIEPGGGTLVAYAAKDGTTAEDGPAGRHSPFTASLLQRLVMPGVDVRRVFGYVSDDVMAATGQAQEPHLYGRLGGDEVYLLPKKGPEKGSDPAGLTPGHPLSPAHPADVAWAAVKDSGDIASLELFRQHYGKDRPVLDRAAVLKIEALQRQKLALLEAQKERERLEALAKLDPARGVKPGSGESFRDRTKDGHPCPACPEIAVVPAGSFTMGSPTGEEGRGAHEGPQRRVTIGRPFAVGKFEVTFAEWDACLAEGGCSHRPDDNGWGRGKRPVMRVSWDDITQQYLPWLSRKTGKTYRLLTEAEWEYVARAGTTTPFWWGASISPSQANYEGNFTYGGGPKGEYRAKTLPVGSFAPNPWGLYNVHGNVWEWVQDCWNDSYNGAPTDGSAWTSGDCSRRILRGGSWFNLPWYLRAALRYGIATDNRDYGIGFRVGRTL